MPLVQLNHKPTGVYAGGLHKLALGDKCQLKETTIIHSQRFVMALLQWQKVYELAVDKLHRPPGGLKLRKCAHIAAWGILELLHLVMI